MKILIVDDDDAIRQYLIVTFENMLTDCDILECTSARQAIMIMESDPYFELIVCDYEMADGNGADLYKHLEAREFNIPFVLHTARELDELTDFPSYPIPEKGYYYLKKGGDYETFKAAMLELPVFQNSQYLPKEESDYRKVRIFYFWRFNKTLCDIYLKLSDIKYVKIINKGDSYGPELIDKYVGREQEHLYIKKEDYDQFAATVAKQPFLVFDDTISQEDKIARTNLIIQQMAMTTGVSRSVIKMSEENINNVMEEAQELDKLGKLLESLKNRMDYGYDHATLLCYIVCVLCDQLEWTARRSKEKLCFAALFHDITLKNPDLAAITNENLDDLRLFEASDMERYMSHPEDASKLVEELSHEYPQVDSIILQHHECPDGGGFPRGLGFGSIQPLPSLFIVAHAFVSKLYQCDFDKEKYPDILASLSHTYQDGHFKKVMESFTVVFPTLMA